jgi:hypothetical protein
VTLTARVLRGADLTVVTELPLSRERRWQDPLNEPGTGSIVLHNDDPALELVDDGDLVQFLLDGAVTFGFIVRSRESHTIADTPDQETTGLAGPGLLAILDRAAVYPLPGLDSQPVQDRRIFSWPAYDFDDSTWGAATLMCDVNGNRFAGMENGGAPLHDTTNPTYWYGATMPKWPDPNAVYVWTWTGPGGEPIDWPLEWAPSGDCYFRAQFNAPPGSIGFQYHVLFDSEGELWLDGTQLCTGTYGTEPNVNTFSGEVPISPGSHQLAARVSNDVDPEGDEWHNPAAFLMVGYTVDAAGGHVGPSPAVQSADCKVLPYPDPPPGMTPGEVLRHVVGEAQARGTITALTLSFTDEADTDGQPWPVVADIATAVGTDVLTFTRELCTTYIDVWLDPATWRLDAWVRDGRGTSRPVLLHGPDDALDPRSGNVRGLVHRRVR